MHRSNFGRNQRPQIVAPSGPTTPLAPVGAPVPAPQSRGFNKLVANVIEDDIVQSVTARLGASVEKAAKLAVAVGEHLKDQNCTLATQIEDVKHGVFSKNEGLATQIADTKHCMLQVGEAIHSRFSTVEDLKAYINKSFKSLSAIENAMKLMVVKMTESLNVKDDIAGLRKELVKLSAATKAQKAVIQAQKADITGAFSKISSQIEAVEVKSGDFELPEVVDHSQHMDAIMDYLNSEKIVMRDNEGNISGWKIAKSVH
jgi:hypothetical protein